MRSVGLDPTNGNVYVFVGSRRKLMKLLHWERGGYVMYYKRLEQVASITKFSCARVAKTEPTHRSGSIHPLMS